ncbi:hypothetical protein D3C72_2395280 [compost metagenome]
MKEISYRLKAMQCNFFAISITCSMTGAHCITAFRRVEIAFHFHHSRLAQTSMVDR